MKKTINSKYEDCFIVYLDILGFKRMLEEGEKEAQIMEIFETLTASDEYSEYSVAMKSLFR